MKKRDQKSTIFLAKNRRGLSTIVVTLIIILISLVAVGIVWVVVRNILTSGAKEVNFGKFTINLGVKNAYEQAGNISVDVKRETGKGELIKVKFILSDGKNSETITQDTNLGELESKIFSVRPVQLVPTQVATVSVAPVFKSTEGTETVGEITSTYNLISGGVTPGADGGNGCVPVCSSNGFNYQCGDDSCGGQCGSCVGTCTNHVCVPPGPCVPVSNETTCGSWVCGTRINNCGQEAKCGTNNGNCPSGQMCQSGSCIISTPINYGAVGDTWPGTSGMYFSSPNLPLATTGLVGDWVSFSGGSTETKCWMIAKWVLASETPGYQYSHIGFNWATSIKTGDAYNIWDSSEKCQANLTLP